MIRTTPIRFIYLDADGLSSLLAQIEGGLETEKSKAKGKERSRSVNAKIGLGKALGAFLGLVDIEGGGELASKGLSSETVTMRSLPENFLERILNYLEESGESGLVNDIPKAADLCKETHGPVYILADTTFDVPPFYADRSSAIQQINLGGYVYFEKDKGPDDYIYQDDYFKRPRIPVIMAASASKFPGLREGKMSSTCHDALLFSHHTGKDVPLHVFGFFFQVGEVFQIKPYAIWI